MYKRLFALLVWLPLSFLQANIIEINCLDLFQKALEDVNERDLVIFDVDDTLIVPNDRILRPCGEDFYEEQIAIIARQISADRWNELASILTLGRKVQVVDPLLPSLIKTLQKKDVRAIALTAMDTGELGLIPSLEDWRYQELNQLGYNFSAAFPHCGHVIFNEIATERSKPGFKNGILCSSKHPKGMVLMAFLEHVHWKPRRVFFLDDTIEAVESVDKIMLQNGIECFCFHYLASQIHNEKLNEEIARIQFSYLINEDEWLADEEVNALNP